MRTKPVPFWTEERLEEAKALYAQGLSHAAIARRIGAPSRNSVIGKLTSIGLAGQKGSAPRPLGPTVYERVGAPAQPIKTTAPTPSQFKARAAARALEPLGEPNQFPPSQACRFTADDPAKPGWRMCGRPGFTWCDEHRKLIFDPPRSHHAVDMAASQEAEANSGIKRAFGG